MLTPQGRPPRKLRPPLLSQEYTAKCATRAGAARRRAQKRAYYRTHAAERRAAQNAKNQRMREIAKRLANQEIAQVHTTTNPDCPNLYYIDRHGNIHQESYLSAEELIREWQRKEKHK
jgi:hypothetical protein